VWYATATVPFRIQYETFFTGRYLPDVAVQCYGLLGTLLSFENVFTQTVRQLIAHCDDVAVHDCRYQESRVEEPFADRRYINPSAPVALYHGVPSEKAVNALAGHRFKIVMFVCDADLAHPDVVKFCNEFDLLVVPSNFCREVFARSGVKKPILVVPHGVDPEMRPCPEKGRGDVFTFYNVYSPTRAYRKSEAELIRCFVRAFDRDQGYRLRLRTSDTNRLRGILDQERAGDVVLIDAEPEPDVVLFASRYSEVHATVHPSKTEGFGMIPLQSLACETPVIAPQVTGMLDYLTPENAMVLRTRGMVPENERDNIGDSGGRMHGIDESHLIQCLRAMADNWESERAKAVAAGPTIRERYSWARVNEPLMELIQQQLRRARRAKVS